MGVFLIILGILLALNVLPLIAGLFTLADDDFFMGFIGAWIVQGLIIGVILLILFIIWLISTGNEMLNAPPEWE